MKFKCDKCGKPATVYLTEITNGQKIEKHLCEQCAASEGVTLKLPISQLLEDFILQSAPSEIADRTCHVCGMSFSEFRKKGLLGCPNDYDAFEDALEPLLSRAHEGATQHIGKIPRRASAGQKKMNTILKLRAQLHRAVSTEDYELAAKLRDQIKDLETS